MKYNKDGEEKMKKQGTFYIVFFVTLIISVLAIIFLGTEYLFHSDDATAVLVAREQILNKCILLKDWNHGTSIWTIGMQTFIIPFMLFLEDWILCRELAVILQLVLFLVMVYKILKFLNSSNIFLNLALFLVPLSEEVLEHSFFQATYMTAQLFCYTIVVMMFYIYKKADCLNSAFGYGIAGILLIGLTCHNNLMSIATTTLPILGAVTLYFVIEKLFLSNKVIQRIQVWYVVGVLVIGSMIAIGMYCILCEKTGFEVAEVGVNEFLGKYGYSSIMNQYLEEFLLLYGGTGETKLLSVEGVLRVGRIFYCLFFCIIIPCFLIRKYKDLSWEQKVFFLYSICVFLILSIVALTTGKCSSRYFLPVYYNNIILYAIFNLRLEDGLLEFSRALQSVIVTIVFGCCLFYITYDYEENKNDIGMWRSYSYTADKGLTEFLEEHEIGFVYAPYWSAYSNMVVSNGKVQAVAYSDNEPMKIKQWLNTDRWCEPEYYNGRTAIIFSAMTQLDPVYWETASEYLQYENWNILVYQHNLLLYDNLKQRKEQVNMDKEISSIIMEGKELKYTGNAEIKENVLYLYKGAIQKWNFCDLGPGEYCVTIRGNNLKDMSVMTYYLNENDKTINIQMKKVQKKNHKITYYIIIDENRKVGFYEKNEMEDSMSINSISVEKKVSRKE